MLMVVAERLKQDMNEVPLKYSLPPPNMIAARLRVLVLLLSA